MKKPPPITSEMEWFKWPSELRASLVWVDGKLVLNENGKKKAKEMNYEEPRG